MCVCEDNYWIDLASNVLFQDLKPGVMQGGRDKRSGSSCYQAIRQISLTAIIIGTVSYLYNF